MAKPMYVRFDMPRELAVKTYDVLEAIHKTGKLEKGTNNVTKAIEQGLAKFVVMAEDVQPEEILAHLPLICEEKNVVYAYVPSKQELGSVAGLEVPTATVAVIKFGTKEKRIELENLINEIKTLKNKEQDKITRIRIK